MGNMKEKPEETILSSSELILELWKRKARLWADGREIRVRAPKKANTRELHPALLRHKEEILTLLRQDREKGLVSLPQLKPEPAQRFEPFPLNEVQQAYWIGRGDAFELGNIATHIYQEFESTRMDIRRLNVAVRKLVERHDMLRAVILPDGSQKVLEEVPPYEIQVTDLSGEDPQTVEDSLESTREKMSHEMLPADRWPLFKICATRYGDNITRLHLSLDMLIVDLLSIMRLIMEAIRLYINPDFPLPHLEITFRDYVRTEQSLPNTDIYKRSRDYWIKRLDEIPPGPELPLVKNPAAVKQIRFKRRTQNLDPETWTQLKQQAKDRGLTPSGVLAAAYAEVLTYWNKNPKFTLNLTLFRRLPFHPQVEQIVGDFTSVTLLSIDNSGGGTFLSRARRIREQLWKDLNYSYYSGIELLREIATRRGNTQRTLMPVIFTSGLGFDMGRDFEAGEREKEILDFIDSFTGHIYGVSQTPQVWLDHQAVEMNGRLVFNWDIVEELFPPGMAEDMFQAYCRLLGQLAGEEDAWTGHLDLLPREQRARLAEVNATRGPIPTELLHGLFEGRVKNHAGEAAVITTQRTLTYRELYERANQVAHRLRELGTQPNQLVAVVMEKGWEQVVAVLGILIAGSAYLPIDAGVPKERLWHLLEISEVRYVLTQARYRSRLEWPTDVQCFGIDDDTFGGMKTGPMESVGQMEDLAYVIFTSGSTGVPKGVVIDHRGAVNTVVDINQRYAVTARDRVFAISNLNFDLSVYDIFGILGIGGAVVIPDAAGAKDPAHWMELVEKYRVTIWNSVPALMQMLVEYAKGTAGRIPASLRLVMMSGDWIPLGLPAAIRSLTEKIELISMGGATEASIWSIWYPIGEVNPEWPSIPYGKPLLNQAFFVLNENLDPCPDWVPGPLYIGGIGLAKGYWRDEAKTDASFIIHPRTGERLYKTGDLGRYLPDGNIEFLGREDFQVKISGYRIELGEIESALIRHERVEDAVVTAVGENQKQKRLVGYLVLTGEKETARLREDPKTLAAEMRDFLLGKLPEYMIPEVFMVLQAFPLTINGKVDRKALPLPGSETRQMETEGAAPTTPTEEKVAALWAGVLKREKVGINDNFFMIGGDSLSGVRINNLVCQAFSIELSLRVLFEKQTVAGVSQVIDTIRMTKAAQETKGTPLSLPQIEPEPNLRWESFPLTDMQQAYLLGRGSLFELGNVSTHVYNEFELDAREIDIQRWSGAFQKLIQRHDMLRAVVLSLNEQKVLREVPPYEVEVLDLRGQDPDTVKERMASIRERMTQEIMPADRWPLFEVRITLYDEHRVRLHISVDMLILDFASVILLFHEWVQYYVNPGTTLPPLALTYRDYVLAVISQQESDLFKRSREYWLQRIDDLPPGPELPLSKNPASIKKPRFTRRNSKLDRETWRRLQQRGKDLGITPSGVLLAAYAEILSLWSKNANFTINLTFASRLPLHPQVDKVIGDFTSVNLLQVNYSSAGTFSARAARLQDQLWQDLDHPYFSGVQLLREIASREGGIQRIAMPVVFTSGLGFSAFEEGAQAGQLPGILGEEIYGITVTSQVWLDHQVFEVNGELIFNWDVVEELFPQGLPDNMFQAYRELLRQLAASEGAWTGPLELLPREQMDLVKSVNSTGSPLSTELLHTLFLRQVEVHAQDLAVITSQRTLTYRELNEHAARVGRQLRRLGTQPNRLVAVVMEKGWEQVVAVMGILMAGSAYLPIDAGIPKERLWHLLEVGEVEFVLTQSRYRDQVEWPGNVQCFSIDTDTFDDMSTAPLEPVQRLEDLAYVIFTSGSTGLPKGVVIDHRGAVNTVIDVNRRFAVDSRDRVFAISNLNFDLSVYDIFGILGAGGAVVIPDADRAKDPAHWMELIEKYNVTLWNSVPALMQMLVEYAKGTTRPLPASIRLVMMSGDWIPVGLPAAIRSVGENIELISMGGATEASIWSILYPIKEVNPEWPSIPYGKPMVNQTFFVLKENLDLCPAWVPGQLYIGGIGLAKGYWRDEVKTNASFVIHPRTGERLYKTGDLGRYLPDGNIEFLGREDFQVKISGYRIELGEIESALIQHKWVKDAVAAAVGENQKQKRLVAYLVLSGEAEGSGDDSKAFSAELRSFLLEKLPEYMVPEFFIVLEAFPLTPNGKVDRKALPKPGETRTAGMEMVEPRDNVERQLLKIWEKILKIHPLGVRHNFFQVGGNSIAAVRLLTEINRQFPGSELRLDSIYVSPTVEQLAILLFNPSYLLPPEPVIILQPGNNTSPFIFVPGGGENIRNSNYYNIVNLIGPGQTFWGLQPQGFQGETPHTTIEEMASYYLQVIREKHPLDSIILAGWCFGGIVAYEMARQAEALGHPVKLLVLIDSQAPLISLDCEKDDLVFITFASNLGYQFGRLMDIGFKDIEGLNEEEKLDYLEKKFEEKGIPTKNIGDSYFRNSYRVSKAHFIAQYSGQYRPQGSLETRVKLLRASETFVLPEFQLDLEKLGIKDPLQLKELQSDLVLGWKNYFKNPVDVCDIPGNHYSLFKEPHVRVLVEKLRGFLDSKPQS